MHGIIPVWRDASKYISFKALFKLNVKNVLCRAFFFCFFDVRKISLLYAENCLHSKVLLKETKTR